MLLKFTHKNKGSISIFLCLILLPMITYAMMVIDASRLQSCRTQLQSAGDLTMNAAMSEYEKILEDMYGLFAVSDDPSALKPALQNYFYETITGTLNSSETENEYIKKYSEQLSDLIFSPNMTDKDVSNFMYMTLDNFSYEPVQESTIANPMIMKSQIIDYMKYKGPVSIVSNLLNKIGLLNDSANQASAAEAKIDYTQSLSALNDPMLAAWNAIVAYNEANAKYEKGAEGIGTYTNKVTIQKIFDNMNGKLFAAAYNMALYFSYKTLFENAFKIDLGGKQKVSENIPDADFVNKTVGSLSSSGIKDYTEAKKRMDELISAFNSKIINTDRTGNELAAFEKTYGKVDISFTGENNTKVDDIEFMSDTENGVADASYLATTANLKYWTTSLMTAKTYDINRIKDKHSNVDCLTKTGADKVFIDYYDLQAGLVEHISQVSEYMGYYDSYVKMKGIYSDIYKKYKGDIPEDEAAKYEKFMNALDKLDSEWKDSKNYTDYVKFVDTYFMDYDQYVTNSFSEATESFRAYYSVVAAMYNSLGNLKKALTDLLKALDVSEKKASDWNKEIQNVEDETVKSQMSNDHATKTKNINRKDVEKLKSLADTLYNEVGQLKNDIEGVTFLGIKVGKENTGWEKAVTKIINTSSAGNTSGFDVVDHFYNTIISEKLYSTANLFNPYVYKGESKISDNVKPYEKINGNKDSNPADTGDEAFYNVLKNSYGTEAKGLSEEEKSKVDSINSTNDDAVDDPGGKKDEKKEEEKKDDDKNGKASEVGDAYKRVKAAKTSAEADDADIEAKVENSQCPDGDDDYSSSADSGKKSMSGAKKFLQMLKDIAKSIGEDVYLEEYFTEMFTCQTDKKLKEGQVQFLNGYANVKNVGLYKPLNTDNAWYGKEIEFILWGDTDLGDNLTKNEAVIFLIRFALNAIYAFTAADIQSFANSIAVALVGWTVVLVPVVEVCITLALALAESALDLVMLLDGEDVVVIKDSTTFICSPSGALATASKKLIEKAVETAVEKGSEFIEDKIDKTIDDVKDLAEKKINDLEKEVNQITKDYGDSLTKTVEDAIKDYCISPLMNTVSPIVSQLNETASNAEQLVEEKVDEAWAAIGSSIDSMSDGTVKELTKGFYDQIEKKAKKELMEDLTKKMKEGIAKIDVNEIQTMISDKINKELEGYRDKIVNKINDVVSDMKKEIMKHGDEAATSLKSYVHEEIGKISKQVTGQVTEAVTNAVSNYAGQAVSTVSKSASGQLTLNYKEYCKIFVFIKLCSNSGERECLQRAAALIECNVKHAKNNADANFQIDKAYTLFYIGVEARMKTLFPWGVKATSDDTGSEGSAGFDISNLGNNSVVIKYHGLNGY
ncbi:MAG: hypothetical protein IKR27_08205 [Lachnospiraceae bacterium]|nr:hypothetical protein [Lachnospiraceae bacterium]